MSAAAEGSGPTTKATTTTDTSSTLKDQQKPAAALEEDDEFEDFPVDGMVILILGYKRRELLDNVLIGIPQIGRQKRARCRRGRRAGRRICGRRAGTTMIRVRIFRSS